MSNKVKKVTKPKTYWFNEDSGHVWESKEDILDSSYEDETVYELQVVQKFKVKETHTELVPVK